MPLTPRAGTPSETFSFSPRSSMMREKGEMTLTQLHIEYNRIKGLLESEKRKNQELKDTLDQTVQELESTIPEIHELRTDHSRLEKAVLEMSNILEESGKERDGAAREARKWQGSVSTLETQGSILQQQLRDLSCQVRVLLMEVHLLSANEGGYDRSKLEAMARNELDIGAEDANPTARFISHHLVTFRNLNELQEQNVILRRMTRELGDRMEAEEASRKDATDDQEKLKELRIKLETYKRDMADLYTQTKYYIKERERFRSLLLERQESGESTKPFSQSHTTPPGVPEWAPPDYTDLLRQVHAQFDAFRREATVDHRASKEQVAQLTQRNNELQEQYNRATSEVMKLSATMQHAELLQSDFNRLQSERQQLQAECQRLHTLYTEQMEMSRQQGLQFNQTVSEMSVEKTSFESLRNEYRILTAEKGQLEATAQRLTEENGTLQRVNDQLQSTLSDRERAEAESRNHLQARVNSLLDDGVNLRAHIKQLEGSLTEKSANSTQVEDLQRQLETSNAQITELQSSLDTKSAQLNELISRIQNNETHTKELESIIQARDAERVQERTQKDNEIKALTEQKDALQQRATGTEANEIAALKEKIVAFESEKDDLLAEKVELQGQIEAIPQKINEAQARQREAFSAQYKNKVSEYRTTLRDQQTAQQNLEKEKGELQEEIKKLQEQVASANASAANAAQASNVQAEFEECMKQKTQLEQEKGGYETEIANLRGQLEASGSAGAETQTAMQNAETKYNECVQQKEAFEQEIAKVRDELAKTKAGNAEALKSRIRMGMLERKVQTYETQIKAVTQAASESPDQPVSKAWEAASAAKS